MAKKVEKKKDYPKEVTFIKPFVGELDSDVRHTFNVGYKELPAKRTVASEAVHEWLKKFEVIDDA